MGAIGDIVSDATSVISGPVGAISKFGGGLFGGLTGRTDPGVANYGIDINKYANRDDQGADRKQQQDFITALQAQMGGHGAVQQLLQNQSEQNREAMIAQAAATRGIDPALALRNSQLAGARGQQQANQAGIQAELGTQGLLGNTLTGMRNEDINNTNNYNQLAAKQAELQTGVAQGNAAGKQKFLSGLMGGAGSSMMGGGGGSGGGGMGGAGGGAMGGIDGSIGADGGPLAALSGGGGGGLAAAAALAEGGKVPTIHGPRSFVARHLKMAAQGGKVPALVSPGEVYLTPGQAKEVAGGKKHAMSAGQKIPGKPNVPGAVNSYANDTVPKKLDSGGVVVPRSKTQSKDATQKADAFVKAVLSRKGK